MNPRLLLVLLALAILGTVGFFMFGQDGDEPIQLVGGNDPVVETEDPEPVSEGATVDGTANANQRTSVVSASAKKDLDPSVRAALSGFRGRLVTPNGAPVPDQNVEIFRVAADVVISSDVTPMLGDARYEPDVEPNEGRSDDDGTFLVQGLWPRGFYIMRAGRESDAPVVRFVDNTPSPGEIVDLGDIVMEPAGILVGRVLDDDGKPIEGALIRTADIPGELLSMAPMHQFDPEGGLIVSEGGRTIVIQCPSWVKTQFDRLPLPMAWTDSDGAFRLTGVTPGRNVFVATAKAKSPLLKSSIKVEAGEEKDLGELLLKEGETLYGRVVDLDDKPIENCEIMAASVGPIPVHFGRYTPRTNAEGEFEMTGFSTGNVIVAARRVPGDPWIVTEAQPILRDIIVQLPSLHEIEVQLTSAAGLEITDPKFQLVPGKLGDGAVEMAMWGATQPLDLKQRLEPVEDEPGKFVVREVSKGRWALMVQAEGHAMAAIDVNLEKSTSVSLTLEKQTPFDVSVVDVNGAPVSGAAVYVQTRGKRPRIPEMPVHGGATDEDGMVTVDAVQASEVRVTAYHAAYGNAHAEAKLPANGPIQLRMAQPGSITGTLTEKGQAPTPGKWTVAISRKWSRGDRGAMPDMPRLVVPDLDGNFELHGLRPGEYELQPMDSLSTLTSPGKMMNVMQSAWMQQREEADATVTPGGSTHVTLDTDQQQEVTGPSANVAGSVMVSGAQPTKMTVMAWSEGRRVMAEVEPNGRFDMGRLAVGHANVELYEMPEQGALNFGRSRSIWSKTLEIKENEDQELTIEVQLSAISGFVGGLRGEPVANCHVSFSGRATGGGDHLWLHTQTEKDGTFELDRIPAGTFTVTAQNEDGKAEVAEVQVAGGIPTTGLRLMMERLLKVSGTLDRTAFGNVESEWTWMHWQKLDANGKPGKTQEWVGCELDKFETSELSPGSWKVVVHGPKAPDGHVWQHDSIVIVGQSDIEGLVIRPVATKRN